VSSARRPAGNRGRVLRSGDDRRWLLTAVANARRDASAPTLRA